MKILHIFGAVVAVHLAVFLVIFAVPGCRSTGKTSSTATSGDSQESTAQLGGEPLPAAGSGAPVAVDTGISYAPAANVRFSPTRPSSGMNDLAASSGGISDTPAPAKSYVVVKGDSLWTVAKKNGVTVSDLAKTNNLKTSTPLQLGQKLSIPSGATSAVAAARSGDTSSETTGPTHVVKGGETLGAIARQHGTTVNTLKRMNGLTSDSLRPGRILLLPEGSVSSMEPAPAPKAAATSTVSRSSGSTKHTVMAGETLGAIARIYGVSAGELSTLNGIADPRKLRPGRELMIPAGGSAKSRPPQTSSPVQTAPVTETPAPTLTTPEVVSPLTPVETETTARPNTDVPVIRIEDPNRVPANPGGEAPRFD